MAGSMENMSLDQRRATSRQKGFQPQWLDSIGSKQGLKNEELAAAINRFNAIETSHSDHSGEGPPPAPCNQMHMFWTNRVIDGSWPRESSFSDGHWHLQLGVASAVSVGYEVNLWTYSDSLRGLPNISNLRLRDASEIVDRRKAENAIVVKQWSEAHIADWVRCKAAQMEPGVSNSPLIRAGAHVCDADVMHFKRLDQLPNESGDAYNSMDGKWSVPQWLSGGDPMRHWAQHFLHEPYLPSWFSSP